MKRPLKPKPTPNYAAKRARDSQHILLPNGTVWPGWLVLQGYSPPTTRRDLWRWKHRQELEGRWFARQGSGTKQAYLALPRGP